MGAPNVEREAGGCKCQVAGATAPEEDVCSATASLISTVPVPSIPRKRFGEEEEEEKQVWRRDEMKGEGGGGC